MQNHKLRNPVNPLAMGLGLLLTASATLAQSVPAPQVIPLAQRPSSPGAEQGFAPTLKFRDPSKPLTLGEISDLQSQKASADLMRKFGYTDAEPIKPRPIAATLARPVLSVKTLAVWGPATALQAEILVNGQLRRVSAREPLAIAPGAIVSRVHARGVEFDVSAPVPAKSPKRKGEPAAQTRHHTVLVGQTLEVAL